MDRAVAPYGRLLRHWRTQRRCSQLALALQAEVSARHLSWLETGKAQPSRAMVLRLAEHLDVPLRERNALLAAAGYAPLFAERSLDDPVMAPARQALQRLLDAHEPWPALAVDRHWHLVAHNRLVAVPLTLHAPAGTLNFITTITVFGAPHDVTLSELAVETLLPADEATAAALRAMHAAL